MSTPFKMNMPSYGQGKNPIQMSESPAKKKVTNEDGSTTRTRKNILTGRTKIVTKSAKDPNRPGFETKDVTVIDKRGTVRKTKNTIANPSQDTKYTTKTKYKKDGSRKSEVDKDKNLSTGEKNKYKKSKSSLAAHDKQFNTNTNRKGSGYYSPGQNAGGVVVDAGDYHKSEIGKVVKRKKTKKGTYVAPTHSTKKLDNNGNKI